MPLLCKFCHKKPYVAPDFEKLKKHIKSNHSDVAQRVDDYCVEPLPPRPDLDINLDEEEKEKQANKDPI